MLIKDRKSYEEFRDSLLYLIERLGRFAKLTIAKLRRR